jgi:ribosomal protein S18 acetylase RimI-like enzyme
MRHPEATDHQVMLYLLVPAMPEDKGWLEQLRRSFYQELFFATWGCWDEARHLRHCAECWERGGIFCLEVEGVRVGMIQLFENSDTIEVGEIQIEPNHQNQTVGSRVLCDTIARAHEQRKKVLLSVALKNERANRLYQRLGFQEIARNETHNLMACVPQDIR